jgi:hypothetical protein
MRNNLKLELCWIGPFEVEQKQSPVTYRLKLPSESRMHKPFILDCCDHATLVMLWLLHLITRTTLKTILNFPNTKFVRISWKIKLGDKVLGSKWNRSTLQVMTVSGEVELKLC